MQTAANANAKPNLPEKMDIRSRQCDETIPAEYRTRQCGTDGLALSRSIVGLLMLENWIFSAMGCELRKACRHWAPMRAMSNAGRSSPLSGGRDDPASAAAKACAFAWVLRGPAGP